MKTTETMSEFPIGAITPYAGDLSISKNLDNLREQGWLLCDGKAYDSTLFPELFAAIGTANGGAGSNFNVPDLRARFLRGTCGNAAGTDPDAASRVAAAPGGSTGNHGGSLQTAATGLPSNAWLIQNAGVHNHVCAHLNSSRNEMWGGGTYSMARSSDTLQVENAGDHTHTLAGFDSATVPVNVALYFIIKANESRRPTGPTPAGAIVGFTGQLSTPMKKWLKCDGAAFGVTLYPDLLNTILYNFGGDGITVANLPDLRGYFLRGSSHKTSRDPDASSRHPLNTGGNAGDNIGSAQFYATLRPSSLAAGTAGAHSHNIKGIPGDDDDHHGAWGASGPASYYMIEWTSDTRGTTQNGDHNHKVIGGDKETRPENIYADFLVATDNLAQSAPPIGSVMSFGGDITDPGIRQQLATAGWIPCDGSALRINSFPALYDVIGKTFGESPLKFNLPDVRGVFLIGAGEISEGPRKGVTVGTVQSVSTTGVPGNPFTTTCNGEHNHQLDCVPDESKDMDACAGDDIASYNSNQSPTSTSGEHTHSVTGGDAETRPLNVNVDYIIRFQ